MNEAYQSLLERRSVRAYKSDPVPQELLEKICTAGTFAATAMGKQSPIILCITDKKLRDRFSYLNSVVVGGDGSSDPFYGAPAVLIVLADKKASTRVNDGTLVMANLMQAAYDLGLGSCWINRAREEFETEECKQLLRDLGIEGEYEGIGHCIVGYAAGEKPAAAPRKENYIYYVK